MYKEDLKRLGTSDKDSLLRKRLTTAISAVKALAYVQKERDWLHRSAQEDAARLADELATLERKSPGPEPEPRPQPKRARPRRACSAALSHAERLEMVRNKHDRAVERVRQIEREYAGRVDQAEVAVSPNNNDAPAKDAAPSSTDASEDESLPTLTDPAAGAGIDMTRRLGQSLQGRKLGLIDSCFKKTYGTTWNDGEQEVKAVLKVTPRSDTRRIIATRREIAAYHRLRPLQGTCIPRLLDYGRTGLGGKRHFAVVMERIEDRDLGARQMPDFRPSIGKLSSQERAACWEAISKMHDLGVIHRDIRGSNLMFRDNLHGPNRTPAFIGLGEAATVDDINDEDKAQEYEYLEQIEIADFNGLDYNSDDDNDDNAAANYPTRTANYPARATNYPFRATNYAGATGYATDANCEYDAADCAAGAVSYATDADTGPDASPADYAAEAYDYSYSIDCSDYEISVNAGKKCMPACLLS
ncbi:hypothetical protein H4R18_003803 [Coemansia javaensis]|uniref:Uncharacterized protein n=1 Tax=Coemansia javaensis TaxID=2761396 RepID=A0A9W8H7K9_9FUNG|nr:hypothetical protein H4R18_003803 [Coemansia javaensis]